MKTGNTYKVATVPQGDEPASMEPGHEDREYRPAHRRHPPQEGPQWSPVMKTGNTPPREGRHGAGPGCLNGARS